MHKKYEVDHIPTIPTNIRFNYTPLLYTVYSKEIFNNVFQLATNSIPRFSLRLTQCTFNTLQFIVYSYYNIENTHNNHIKYRKKM